MKVLEMTWKLSFVALIGNTLYNFMVSSWFMNKLWAKLVTLWLIFILLMIQRGMNQRYWKKLVCMISESFVLILISKMIKFETVLDQILQDRFWLALVVVDIHFSFQFLFHFFRENIWKLDLNIIECFYF